MKKNNITAGLLVVSLTFFCGVCDPTSHYTYLIENNTDTAIEVRLYGVRLHYYDFPQKDSIQLLATGEYMTLFHIQGMGEVHDSRIDSVYFLDSIVCKRLDNNMLSKKNFRDFKEWTFIKTNEYNGKKKLIIDNTDF